MDLLRKLFGSRKWIAAFTAIIVDVAAFLALPTQLATEIATFVTLTAGIIIGAQAIEDTFGG